MDEDRNTLESRFRPLTFMGAVAQNPDVGNFALFVVIGCEDEADSEAVDGADLCSVPMVLN